MEIRCLEPPRGVTYDKFIPLSMITCTRGRGVLPEPEISDGLIFFKSDL